MKKREKATLNKLTRVWGKLKPGENLPRPPRPPLPALAAFLLPLLPHPGPYLENSLGRTNLLTTRTTLINISLIGWLKPPQNAGFGGRTGRLHASKGGHQRVRPHRPRPGPHHRHSG